MVCSRSVIDGGVLGNTVSVSPLERLGTEVLSKINHRGAPCAHDRLPKRNPDSTAQ